MVASAGLVFLLAAMDVRQPADNLERQEAPCREVPRLEIQDVVDHREESVLSQVDKRVRRPLRGRSG